MNGIPGTFQTPGPVLRAVGLLSGVLLCIPLAGCGRPTATARLLPTVQVVQVQSQDVAINGEWVATLDGNVNAQIQPQVTGYLIRQDYKEGAYVHKDDVLFEIDPRPFQAALDLAKAQLAQAQAQLGNATLNVKRDIPEAEAGAISRSQLETDTQAQLAARASVAAAEAAVEQAALNLGFTKVRSLINGIAGITQVQVGNLVNASTVLTSVSDVDPIRAYFPVTTAQYLQLSAQAGAQRPLTLLLPDSEAPALTGRLLFADRQVDPQTGAIRLAGAFANPGNVLRPGQYAKVRAVTRLRKAALLVPQRAVTELQGAPQVAVVAGDGHVSIRTVQVGEKVGALWIITAGLKPGEQVVAEGTGKVQDGALVTPAPYQSAAEVTP